MQIAYAIILGVSFKIDTKSRSLLGYALLPLILIALLFGLFLVTRPAQAALGDSNEPAKSCQQIKQENPAAASGLYWLRGPSMPAAQQYYCDMTTGGGGWQLAFKRAGGSRNRETCSGTQKNTLNDFLHDGACGSVNNLAYGDSYISDDFDVLYDQFSPAQYMDLQARSNGVDDNDDAFVLHTNKNLFPNSSSISSVVDISIDRICDINGSNCDSTDVYWKYIGNSWFHSARCQAGNAASNPTYGGNYGYCHNGLAGGYSANTLYGNRGGYSEAKLYGHSDSSRLHSERVFIRSSDDIPPSFDEIALDSNNAKNPGQYAKAGDQIEITIKLKASDKWKSSYNKPTFSIGSTTGLQTANYLGSTSSKLSGYRNYTVLAGQNGTLKFTDLNFKNRDDIDIVEFNAPYTPNSNIIVDTTLPNINFTDDVAANPSTSDTINIQVSDTNPDSASYKYGFSDDATCDNSDTYPNALTSGSAFTISDNTNYGKYICVRAEDMAGNVAYKASANPIQVSALTTTPTTAPDLKASSDSGSSDSDNVTNDNTPTITGNCIAGSQIKIYIGGTASGDSTTCNASGSFEVTLSGSLADGIHNLTYTQKSSQSGYQESGQSPNLRITIDTVDPVNLTININIETPHSLDNPRVQFSAVDNDSGIDRYTAQADGGPVSTQTSPYEPTLTPANSHTLVVTAYDVAGNSTSREVAYPPVVNIISPTVISNAPITDTTIRVNGPNSITEVTASGAGSSNLNCTPAPSQANPQAGPINCTVSVGSSGELTIRAKDTTGSTGTASQTYTIETVPPTIEFVNDVASGSVQSDTISLRVSDANPDNASYKYGFSDDATCDASDSYTENFASEVPFIINTEAHNGKYICVQAKDRAGNLAYKASTNPLKIDVTAPSLSLIGDNPLILTINQDYDDPGVNCRDNIDATCNLVVDDSAVDKTRIGEYQVTYKVTDRAGNTSTITRTVKFVDKPTSQTNNPAKPDQKQPSNLAATGFNVFLIVAVSVSMVAVGIFIVMRKKNKK